MNHIFYARDSWATPLVREIPFDWRDFEPLARAEASKFYWKQERGRFRFEDIYSEAVAALATGKGVNHAIECIKGALLDYARDGEKLVSDVEMSAEKWQRTHGEPERPIQGPWRVYFENGVRVIVCPTGPYRSNAWLLAGSGKPTSKHGKVRCAIGRALYDEGWNQQVDVRQLHADDADQQSEQEAARLPQKDRVPQRGQPGAGKPKPSRDYKGGGRKQRWSKSCVSSGCNAGIKGAALKSIPDLSPPGSVADCFIVGSFLRIREPAKSGDRKADPALSKWSRDRYQLCLGTAKSGPSYIPRHVAPPLLDIATPVSQFGLAPQNGPAGPVEARAIAKLLIEVPAEDKEMSPAEKKRAKKLALERELPKFPAIPWHREAGSFPDLDEKTWGLPDFGVICRGDLPYFGKKKDPWRRGINIFASSSKISAFGRRLYMREAFFSCHLKPRRRLVVLAPAVVGFLPLDKEGLAQPPGCNDALAPAACQVTTRSCGGTTPFWPCPVTGSCRSGPVTSTRSPRRAA